MNLADLDKISTSCPIIVLHASLHILNTNSFVVEKAGVSPGDNNEAIRRDDTGQPTGEFLGQLGMYMACLLYTSPSPRDRQKSRMPSSA